MKVYTLFDTMLGYCGIVWKTPGPVGAFPIAAFQLPEATPLLTEARVERRWEAKRAQSVPLPIQNIIRRVKLHLSGESQDFGDIELDLDGVGKFAKAIYQAARAVPAGQTTTYGQLAEAVGCAGAARTVGQAMSRNPVPLIIPCHRVIAAGGRRGGFSAHGGLMTKAKMLETEGVTLGHPGTIRT